MSELIIKRLTPELADDFFGFFEGEAFADNPKWAGCYCRFCHIDHAAGEPWDDQDAANNRPDVARRIADGGMTGYLAYAEGGVVGWVNAAASRHYPAGNIGGPYPEAARTGQVMCFVVAPSWRGKGVARALLEGALADFKAQGLTIAQAKPRLKAASDGANHQGPMSLYRSAGFKDHKPEGENEVFVRRVL
jgi:GNAT superfamily N-acetyltransferase